VVDGTPSYGVKGLAGTPIVSSWEKARSSVFLMIASSSKVNLLKSVPNRMGLFKKLQTYDNRHVAKRAAVTVWKGTTAYIFGGINGGVIAQQFTAIDLEIDSFREEELLLASLPKFAELNRHLKVVVLSGKKILPRADGEICDPYLVVVDPEWPLPRASAPCEASLSPVFNHEFYFDNVPQRKDFNVVVQLRDAKDELLMSQITLNLINSMKLCARSGTITKMYKFLQPGLSEMNGEFLIQLVGF